MQGTGFGYAGTRSARMIGDDEEPSGFERAEDGPIHRRTVHTQMSEVVIVEHQGHQIDLFRRQFRRNGILKGPGESDDRAAGMPASCSLASRSANATGDGRGAAGGAAEVAAGARFGRLLPSGTEGDVGA